MLILLYNNGLNRGFKYDMLVSIITYYIFQCSDTYGNNNMTTTFRIERKQIISQKVKACFRLECSNTGSTF